MKIFFFVILCFTFLFCNSYKEEPEQDEILSKLKVPEGFKISLYADNVDNARSLLMTPNGTLFVSTRDKGKIYAILDHNKDFVADEVITIATGLNMPNGIAFSNGSLYVAEVNRVTRYDNIEQNLKTPPKPVIIRDDFPTEKHHGWKYIAIGPDNKLYVPIGAPCNVCLEEDKRFSTITRMNLDGTEFEIFANGVRNTVGFDWHPVTNELWFTDNGRDMMGDDIPADELNRAAKKDLHFGFPFLHGKNVLDPEFGNNIDKSKFTLPVQELGPHVASLGMKFYDGKMFPEKYKNQIFIAERGSWNRSKKIGYRVTLVKLDGNNAVSYEPFAEGWLQPNEKVLGRPVDVLVLSDGSLLVSDDTGDRIYRITYEK